MQQKNIFLQLSFDFAVNIIRLTETSKNNQLKEQVIFRQLIRSGTAVGALIREAQNAESKADFIHKLAIAQKECDESRYWLELMQATGSIEQEHFRKLHQDSTSLLKMIRSSILTTRQNIRHKS